MEALRRIRTMRGLNQVDLARASGVAQNTISEIELGKRKARPGTLKKLADALSVEIADLFEEARPLGQAPPETQEYGAMLEEMGFPPEQIESWRTQEERDNEAITRELENMSAKDFLETLMSTSPALRRYYRDNTPRKGAPRSSTQPPLNGFEEERRPDAYELAWEAARQQAVQDRQAFNRVVESERPQACFKRHENEAVPQLSKYPAEELAAALFETATAREEERSDSILAKALAVAAERWARVTSAGEAENAPGVYLVAADLEELLSIVIGDGERWERLSSTERSELATVAAAFGRITEGYHARKEDEQAANQRQAMVRQLTRKLAKTA